MLWPNGSTVEPRLSGAGTPAEAEADFGPRKTGKKFHDGVDYSAYFIYVRSVEAGEVVRVERWDGKPAGSTRTQHGNRVWVYHGDGVETSYSHLDRVDVKVGDRVEAGQAVGVLGDTGFASGPHLHFEVRVWGVLVDPRPFVRSRVGGSGAGIDAKPFEPDPKEDTEMKFFDETREIFWPNGMYSSYEQNDYDLIKQFYLYPAHPVWRKGRDNFLRAANHALDYVAEVAAAAVAKKVGTAAGFTPEQVETIARAASEASKAGASEAVKGLTLKAL